MKMDGAKIGLNIEACLSNEMMDGKLTSVHNTIVEQSQQDSPLTECYAKGC